MEKWKIGWGISNLCNMRCGFCYSRKARQEPDFHDNIREGLRLIRENKDLSARPYAKRHRTYPSGSPPTAHSQMRFRIRII